MPQPPLGEGCTRLPEKGHQPRSPGDRLSSATLCNQIPDRAPHGALTSVGTRQERPLFHRREQRALSLLGLGGRCSIRAELRVRGGNCAIVARTCAGTASRLRMTRARTGDATTARHHLDVAPHRCDGPSETRRSARPCCSSAKRRPTTGRRSHSIPSMSPRSLARPVARLLRMKASRPMKSTATSPNGRWRRPGHASPKVMPVRSVRMSMRPGGTPI